MKAPAFTYRRPRDTEAALSLLAEHCGGAQVLAGGQSLIPTLNMRLSSPDMLVDINQIEALRGIEDRGHEVRIGALVRHAEVLDSAVVAARVPLLALAIPHVAHMAVRNRGTTCGSLALADPAAEMPAVAVALDAHIVLRSRAATRKVPARAFFQDLYQTARNDDELIAEVLFPAASANEVFGFAELNRRHGDFAVVGAAAKARKVGESLQSLTVVVFGCERKPLLSTRAADATIDAGASDQAIRDLANAIAEEMDPMENHQGRSDTKRKQGAVLLQRLFHDMRKRAVDARAA
jgi:aerobic carbon-monoxide dehydrogenase medium subunit